MRRTYLALAGALDRVAWAVCLVTTTILTLVVLAVVVLRYGFGLGYIQLQDTATYAFAVLVIFSVPVCLARDGHVRVEVISERLSPAYRHAADAAALVLCLIPVFGIMLWAWWPQVVYAWSIREASIETGGLPGLYLVKTALPVAAALTVVQGLAAVLKGSPMTVHEIFLLVLVAGLFGGILSGIPAMLAIAGAPLLTAVAASLLGQFDLSFLNFYPARVWGVMTNTLLMAVPLFVLMGVLLERSGLAERMLDVLSRMLGGSPRGITLSVLVFSTLIAASTGIIGATVVMLVLISLPAMLDAGVRPRLASGVICASGTLGQIIPPSILLVLLGDQIGNAYLEAQQKAGNFAIQPVSVGDLFAGALIPGLILVGLYAVFIAIALRPAQGTRAPRREAVPMPAILSTFLPPILLILAVLGSILAGVATTTEAAGLGAVGALLLAGYGAGGAGPGRVVIVAAAGAALAFVGLRIAGAGHGGTATLVGAVAALLIGLGTLAAGWRVWRGGVLVPALTETVRISGMVFGIVIAASMLSLVFRGFGGDHTVAHLLTNMPGGTTGALALVMAVVFLLGFMLEAVEIIYIVVPLLGPPLLGSDISPVWFGVLLAMNLQTSFLTPPFGFALFYFRSVAPRSITTRDIYFGVIPFVCLQVAALGILMAVPELATWLPDLMFR